MCVRIWVSIQARKIKVHAVFLFGGMPIDLSFRKASTFRQVKTRAVGILIRVKQDIRAVVFIVTAWSVNESRTIEVKKAGVCASVVLTLEHNDRVARPGCLALRTFERRKAWLREVRGERGMVGRRWGDFQ